ncbi:GNAT family N-acetyltransferase [Candidatus Micrarchaeota archaeon]|nr:GNAT family N-acetyltransferase [Candidatus Micrarchaeota archaeon]MBI5176792.1 GNAT family N-acetyltransferase [Candidatus Micrarchaeota archaeon]
MPRDHLPVNDLTITALNPGVSLDTFNCDDSDLNDFLKKDAPVYEHNGIARTYVCLYQNSPIGFFSICADAIRLSMEERKGEFGKGKLHPDYPAMKIARLGVSADFQGRGVGTSLVKIAIGKAISLSREIGCRFVTVDSYPKQVDFYLKCGFIRNLEDKSGENVSLRLDLLDYLSLNQAR